MEQIRDLDLFIIYKAIARDVTLTKTKYTVRLSYCQCMRCVTSALIVYAQPAPFVSEGQLKTFHNCSLQNSKS